MLKLKVTLGNYKMERPSVVIFLHEGFETLIFSFERCLFLSIGTILCGKRVGLCLCLCVIAMFMRNNWDSSFDIPILRRFSAPPPPPDMYRIH